MVLPFLLNWFTIPAHRLQKDVKSKWHCHNYIIAYKFVTVKCNNYIFRKNIVIDKRMKLCYNNDKGSNDVGEKDTVTKKYMEDSATFADAFNFLMYDGEQVIKPEQLKEMDTTALALPYGEGERPVPVQKYRDLLKMVTAMTDGNVAYLILGIENQSAVHYAMPPKNMLYDAAEYVAQVDDAATSHGKGKKSKSRAEFLSGFYRTDKLLPVITLTIYFGADEWTAPKSIHEMLSIQDERILKFVPDYRINLITPADIADEDFAKFHTELSLALKYIKYSKSKKMLKKVVQEDNAFKDVSKRTADMVSIVTESDLHYAERKERVNMCEAIRGIKNDGIEEGTFKTLMGLVKKGLLTLTQAAEEVNLSVEEFEEKVKQLSENDE